MTDRLRITTSDGKYTVIQPMDGPATVLRYGEPWPAYEGRSPSNLELALAYELDEARKTLLDHEALASFAKDWPVGTRLHVEHDGFSGTVQGHYITREGKPGLVLQLDNAKVIHVYGVKWFTPKEASDKDAFILRLARQKKSTELENGGEELDYDDAFNQIVDDARGLSK